MVAVTNFPISNQNIDYNGKTLFQTMNTIRPSAITHGFYILCSFFLPALFSKAKGQYLRLALPLHALFQPSPLPDTLPNIIPEPVQKASISLVGLCIEHTALLAGREVKDGKLTPREPCIPQETELECSDKVLQQIIINYPGITDDDLPQFLRSLQHLGLTLEAYNAAYENDTHPNAAETLGQYNQATEGVKEQTAKRIKIDDAMSSMASKET